MRKIFKFVLMVDTVLLLVIGFIAFTGCYLGREGRIKTLVENKHRIMFRVYNNTDMLFAPDGISDNRTSKKTSVNLPSINITVVDIPPNAPNINGILNLHYSVALGFLPGTPVNIVNKALYNGHKTFRRVAVQQGGIDLSNTERQNIDLINRILAQGDYDGIYMSLEDSKALDRYPSLSKKIHGSLSFVTVNDTVCYKSQICYVAADASQDVIKSILHKVSTMSELEGRWTIVFSYTPNIEKMVVDAISTISLRNH